MAKKNPGYAMKSPRGRPHDLVARTFDHIEDSIYVLVAALLVVAGAFVLWTAITELIDQVGKPIGPSLMSKDAGMKSRADENWPKVSGLPTPPLPDYMRGASQSQ